MRALGFGRSAIWGGATLGLIIGFVVGLFTGNISSSIKNGIIVGLVLGIVAEILGTISGRISPKSNTNKMIDSVFAEGKYLRKYEQLLGSKAYNDLFNKHVSPKATFEPIVGKLSKTDKDYLYSKIDRADFLSPQERFETILATIDLIGGSIPESKEMMARFKKIFGQDFVKTIKKKTK